MPKRKSEEERGPIVDFPLEGCTPSQKEVLDYVAGLKGSRGLVWWMGGVRAGKSFGSCIAMMQHQKTRRNKQYIVLAYTSQQGIQIFGSALQQVAEAMGYECKLTRGASPRFTVVDTGNEFLFKGADKEGRDKGIQGLTLSGLIVDEVPNLMREAIHQAEARCSDPGSLRIYTCNKTSPYHWTTKYYLERLQNGKIQGLVQDCSLQDNPHIDSEYAEELSNEFEGATLTRFMENEFTLDGKPIYQPVIGLRTKHCEDDESFTAIMAHHQGYEVVKAVKCFLTIEFLEELKERGLYDSSYERACLNIVSADSVSSVKIEKDETIFLNHSQRLLARKLFLKNHRVKPYPEGFCHDEHEVMQEACKQNLVRVKENSGIMEALACTYKPGDYRWPIVRAFEALAYVLRNDVS